MTMITLSGGPALHKPRERAVGQIVTACVPGNPAAAAEK